MKVQALFSGLPADVCGIGGHPMAGAEIAGIQGADRYLYENAVYVLTPAADTPRPAIDRLSGLIGETGAKVHIMEARLHDRIVAQVSHVPHLAAAAAAECHQGRPAGYDDGCRRFSRHHPGSFRQPGSMGGYCFIQSKVYNCRAG